MADLEQIPGELNLVFISGDDLSFTASFAGDYTTATHSAYVYDGLKLIATFTVSKIFTTPNTIVSFVLSDTQTITNASPLNWYYVIDNAGDKRTMLAGTVEVKNK